MACWVCGGDVLEESDLNAHQHETVGIIKHSSTALLRVIDDILNLTKIESGQVSITTAPFAISDMISNCLDVVRQSCATKGFDLSITISADIPRWVIGDAGRIQQVLVNFLGNAIIKFTSTGSIDLRVGTRPQQRIRFSVQDTGVGFDQAKNRQLI